MSEKKIKKSYSKRHKRRLVETETNAELLDIKQRILLSTSKVESSKTVEIIASTSHNQQCTSNNNYLNSNDNDYDADDSNIIDKRNNSPTNENNFDLASEFCKFSNEQEVNSIYHEADLFTNDLSYTYSNSDVSDINLNTGDDESMISTDCELDNPETLNKSNVGASHPFVEAIGLWIKDNKIHHNKATALLKVLNTFTGIKFPKDSRTIVNTPQNTKIESMKSGEYCHLGLKEAVIRIIKKLIENKLLINNENKVNLFVSTDGAPIGKSSGLSMWPILCSPTIFHFVQVIGIFLGEKKPDDSNDFFFMFVKEGQELINNGLVYNQIKYEIKIKALICDTPAKSFALHTKYHSGFNSCTKCTIYGQVINNTVCFPNEVPEPQLRTDDDFLNVKYSEQFCDDYQKKETILKNLNFGLVSGVPLDYMHLVCLGVMKKLLLLWLRGPLKYRLSYKDINKISEDLISIRKSIPSEFQRKTRSLKFLKIWKATEFRNFLLYVGPIVLKKVLHEKAYEHFLMLHVAIRLLADSNFVKDPNNIQCADDLLQRFVVYFEKLYGKQYVSFNVHNLKHLAADVKKYGALDKFSAFQFESYICALKRLIRKGDKPLQQIARRLHEFDHEITGKSKILYKNIFLKCHHHGLLTDDRIYVNEYKKMFTALFNIDCSDGKNDCVLLKDNTIVRILNLAESIDKKFYIIGEKLLPTENLYELPYSSSLLNITEVHKSNTLNSWDCNTILCKMFKISYGNKFVVFPIVHSSQQ